MWNRKDFEERMKKENIEIRYWGRYGKSVLEELERALKFKFNDEIRSFIEEIGNLDMGSCDIVIAGNEKNTYNCVTESKDVELLQEDEPATGVKIMDDAGMSYILHKDGSIKAYEHTYIKPDGIVFSYDSLSHLVETLVRGRQENK